MFGIFTTNPQVEPANNDSGETVLGRNLPRYTPPPKYEDIPLASTHSNSTDHEPNTGDPEEGTSAQNLPSEINENIYEDATVIENLARRDFVEQEGNYCIPSTNDSLYTNILPPENNSNVSNV